MLGVVAAASWAGDTGTPPPPALRADIEASAASDARRIAALLAEVEAATNNRDVDRLLRQATDEVVVVSKNGETLVGREALAGYLRKMIGAVPALREMRSRVRQDGPPVVSGDTALAVGRSDDLYVFSAGMRLEITTIWSATLVRNGEGWRIARLHFSFDLFSNPLLASARVAAWIAGGLALAAGLLTGGLGAWLLRRRPRLRATPT